MEDVRKFTTRCALVYIDDITIFSPSLKQHLVNLEDVFEKLQRANLKLNLNKCKFALTEVKVLRHLVFRKEI